MESNAKSTNPPPAKHKISIQMPTTLPAGTTDYYGSSENFLPNTQQYAQAFHLGSSLQKIPTATSNAFKQPLKRDSSSSSKLGTSSGSTDADGKNKKLKLSKEKKEKKIVRCAGGQTWEDNSLADWDSGSFFFFSFFFKCCSKIF